MPLLLTGLFAIDAVSIPAQVSEYANPSDATWHRYIGDHGGFAISLAMGGLFLAALIFSWWREGQNRVRSEESTERRHQESLSAAKAHSDELKALVVDVANVSIRATAATEKVAEKLDHLDAAATAAEKLLLSRWCLLKCNPMLRSIMEKLIVELPEDTTEIPPSPASRPNP